MKIKVSEATSLQLNWLVAKCEGALYPLGNVVLNSRQLLITIGGSIDEDEFVMFTPSTDPAQSYPIIEREKIQSGYIDTFKEWECRMQGGHRAVGPTPLIAAMCCYVTSKLGDEAEIPEELA